MTVTHLVNVRRCGGYRLSLRTVEMKVQSRQRKLISTVIPFLLLLIPFAQLTMVYTIGIVIKCVSNLTSNSTGAN
jgi:hypothetical protein